MISAKFFTAFHIGAGCYLSLFIELLVLFFCASFFCTTRITATTASFTPKWVEMFHMLDMNDVVRLLDFLGYGEYGPAFLKAGIRGSELLVLESNVELSELGIKMSLLHSKSLIMQLNKVKLYHNPSYSRPIYLFIYLLHSS